jgi:hypothetical protein
VKTVKYNETVQWTVDIIYGHCPLQKRPLLTNFNDMNGKDQIPRHATSTGRLYIDENEFFKTPKVRRMIEKLLNSSLYKEIKANEARMRSKG